MIVMTLDKFNYWWEVVDYLGSFEKSFVSLYFI